MNNQELQKIGTERQNPATKDLDKMTPLELVTAMNREDQKTVKAVQEVLPQIAKAADICADVLKAGGRMIYLGAGTSGRIGLMDAVECVPTFSCEQVIGLIAGGKEAFIRAVEGAEDAKTLAVYDLESIALNEKDIVIGIAASGRTPYVIGGLEYAEKQGAKRISIACNRNVEISDYADVAIEVDAGPEVLTGSTRLKSGTCQKMICNMLSTAAMVKIGKVYKNLMVDMRVTNKKLAARAVRILMQAADVTKEQASQALVQAGGNMKAAILMLQKKIPLDKAIDELQKAGGFVRVALEEE